MRIEIVWFDTAERNFSLLDKKIQERIVKKLADVSTFPERYITKLTDIDESKLRVGNFRLFVDYDRQRGLLRIHDVKHRKNAYK